MSARVSSGAPQANVRYTAFKVIIAGLAVLAVLRQMWLTDCKRSFVWGAADGAENTAATGAKAEDLQAATPTMVSTPEMALNEVDGKVTWTRIAHCSGPRSVDRLDFLEEEVLRLARQATRVRICAAGDPNDCVVSKRNSFPIMMLRKGWTISHDNGEPCGETCTARTWSGKPARVKKMWNKCGSYTEGALNGTVLLVHSCENPFGMHLSLGDHMPCSWQSSGSDHLDVFIDVAVPWTRIAHCDNGTSANRLDVDSDAIQEMAHRASQVRICAGGSRDDCVESAPGSFPIRMLRKGWALSHYDGHFCDEDCTAKTWSGRRAPSQLWNFCGEPTEGALNGTALLYHACENSNGLHLSLADGGLCQWGSAPGPIEVYVNAPRHMVEAAMPARDVIQEERRIYFERDGGSLCDTRLQLECLVAVAAVKKRRLVLPLPSKVADLDAPFDESQLWSLPALQGQVVLELRPLASGTYPGDTFEVMESLAEVRFSDLPADQDWYFSKEVSRLTNFECLNFTLEQDHHLAAQAVWKGFQFLESHERAARYALKGLNLGRGDYHAAHVAADSEGRTSSREIIKALRPDAYDGLPLLVILDSTSDEALFQELARDKGAPRIVYLSAGEVEGEGHAVEQAASRLLIMSWAKIFYGSPASTFTNAVRLLRLKARTPHKEVDVTTRLLYETGGASVNAGSCWDQATTFKWLDAETIPTNKL